MSRRMLTNAFLAASVVAFGIPRARAQDPGLGGMLGGFGAMAGGSSLVNPSGMGGSVIVPAAGGTGASISPSMTNSRLSFRSRPGVEMEAVRRPFVLDTMGGMSRISGRRPFALEPRTLTGGMGLGGMQRMPTATAGGVMPPRIGYPFRQPTSFPTSGVGASM